MKFGAHMPTSGGAWRSLERGIALGCDIVQLFVKNWNNGQSLESTEI